MPRQRYSASLSRTQGRSGFSIIFRHPVRLDQATGKPGLRVRRGLATREESEAEGLRDELNVLLGDPKFHDPSALADARERFDARVVDIFFEKMVPADLDSSKRLREDAIPLPESGPDGYRKILLLGTTGAGKTTVVRQLIGTDPKDERFPATSTAKCTIHDTEIVLSDGDWRAAVTFAPRNEVLESLKECISAAVLSATKDGSDAEMLGYLLNHVDQRFRFGYVLGNGPASASTTPDFEDDLDFEQDAEVPPVVSDAIDLAYTDEVLVRTITKLRGLAQCLRERVYHELQVREQADEGVADELIEEELDNLIRGERDFHEAADLLMDEIAKRFDLLPPGNLQKSRQGWPIAWSGEWPAEERKEFLSAVRRFSSNYAPRFGQLLTPLVNGVRVAGPFLPTWDGSESPKLVLLDGEGLGHTSKSSAAVSTAISRNIDGADAVLLVDSATQPMQASSVAAMREVVITGSARKLLFAFTRFDEVQGDNLPNAAAKARHLVASAENAIAALGEELAPSAARALRQRLAKARFFLAEIHKPLNPNTLSGKRTISQLKKLVKAAYAVLDRPQSSDICRPVYDRMNLVLAIRRATKSFHHAWRQRLGLEGSGKEHWTRVKALNRRLAEGWKDHYDTLHPIADLRRNLQKRLYMFVQNPLRWEGREPGEDEKQGCLDVFAEDLGRRIVDLCERRIWHERLPQWNDAYAKYGIGSTRVRAKIIVDEVFGPAAPVPDVTPSPDRNQFLREVSAEVQSAAEQAGAVLQ